MVEKSETMRGSLHICASEFLPKGVLDSAASRSCPCCSKPFLQLWFIRYVRFLNSSRRTAKPFCVQGRWDFLTSVMRQAGAFRISREHITPCIGEMKRGQAPENSLCVISLIHQPLCLRDLLAPCKPLPDHSHLFRLEQNVARAP